MEWLVLGAFCAALLLCVALGQSILYALAAGFVLFLLYGRRKGFAWSRLFRLALDGVLTVKNILITFLLIGMLTALWRQAGTIPVIVCFSARLIRPALCVVMAFLLNCLVSFLTGTSFGTAATMGVICAAIGSSLGLNQLLVGGAVLSGVYFGDRCSPVSTSALLVSELTRTDVFHNIRSMVRSALVPFLLSCGVYGLLGVLSRPAGEVMDLEALFAPAFSLSWLALIPALVILALSLMQVNVKIAMSASILSALPVCLLVQHAPIADLPRLLFFGYRAADSQPPGPPCGSLRRHPGRLHPRVYGGLQPDPVHSPHPPAVRPDPGGPGAAGPGPGGCGGRRGPPGPLVHRRGRPPGLHRRPHRLHLLRLLSLSVAPVAAVRVAAPAKRTQVNRFPSPDCQEQPGDFFRKF